MNYADTVASLQNLMVLQAADANFAQILPAMITSAEQRMYRDLDLIATVVTDTSVSTQTGTRGLTIPAAYVVVQTMATLNASNARTPMTPVARTFIDTVYGDLSVQGVPLWFAMVTQNTMVLGPVPDAPYTVEITGTQRPATLSSTQTNTFLSDNLPDMFLAACMIFGAGYQKNYGAQADDPKAASSWQQQYDDLLKAAGVEELRKRFQAQSWSSQLPTPAAPPRG